MYSQLIKIKSYTNFLKKLKMYEKISVNKTHVCFLNIVLFLFDHIHQRIVDPLFFQNIMYKQTNRLSIYFLDTRLIAWDYLEVVSLYCVPRIIEKTKERMSRTFLKIILKWLILIHFCEWIKISKRIANTVYSSGAQSPALGLVWDQAGQLGHLKLPPPKLLPKQKKVHRYLNFCQKPSMLGSLETTAQLGATQVKWPQYVTQ